ncbi:hypothetical protein [Arthrobacter sp. TMS1-12-1]
MHSSIADQTTDQLGGPLGVLVRPRRDHVKLSALTERLPVMRAGRDRTTRFTADEPHETPTPWEEKP